MNDAQIENACITQIVKSRDRLIQTLGRRRRNGWGSPAGRVPFYQFKAGYLGALLTEFIGMNFINSHNLNSALTCNPGAANRALRKFAGLIPTIMNGLDPGHTDSLKIVRKRRKRKP
jgi:hypothetical protein